MGGNDLLMTLAEMSAYNTGRMCGSIIAGLVVLLGLLKCSRIARRPTTSTTCVLALTMPLVAWFLAIVSSVLRQVLGKQLTPLFYLLVALVIAALTVTGIVLGIVGLATYGQKKDLYRQGRHQAVWGLILSTLFMCALAVGVAQAAARRSQALVPAPVVGSGEGEEVVEFGELNFRIRLPGKPWVRYDVKKVNPDATVGILRRRPDTVFMVIAENGGASEELTADGLAEISQANLRQAATEVNIGTTRPETHSGIDGLRFESTAKVNGIKFSYSHWVGTHRGYLFQMLTCGPGDQSALVHRESRNLCAGFELINRERTVESPAAPPLDDFAAPQFGYSVAFDDSGWSEWPNLAEKFPEAHCGAKRGGNMCFGVVPLLLAEHDPDLEAVTAALLDTLNFEYPGAGVTRIGPITQRGVPGHLLTASRRSSGLDFAFRVRVLRSAHAAYLLVGWCLAGDEALDRQVDAMLDRVSLADTPPTGELSVNERQTQANLWDYLARKATAAGQMARAVAYLDTAWALDDQDAQRLNALADACENNGRSDQALAVLEAHYSRFPDDRELNANRAWQLGRLERKEEAVAAYADVFGQGYEDATYFGDYLDQLLALGRSEEALQAVDVLLVRKPALSWKLRKVDLLDDTGRGAEALGLMQELHEAHPSDNAVTLRLSEQYFKEEQFDECRALCERLIASGQDTAYVNYVMGLAELNLRWYPAAKASFERAAQQDPADRDYKEQVEYVSGLLGQGDNSMVKQVLAPVPIPPAVQTVLDEAASTAWTPGDEFGAAYEQRVTGISFTADGEFRQTEYQSVRLLGQAGVTRLSTLVFPFDPLGEQIYVNEVTVKEADGSVAATGMVDTYYAIDDSAGNVASQRKLLHVPVPGLKVGRTLEFAVTRQRREERFPFTEHFLFHEDPVRVNVLFVQGAVEFIKFEADPQAVLHQERGLLAWSLIDGPVFFAEGRQPWPQTYLPTAALADQRSHWPELAAGYLADLAGHLQPDEAARARAAQLTVGLNDPVAQRAALVRYAQREYRYEAIEFGERARIPHIVSRIIENGYGDCKDHALLLYHLLRAQGIAAHLALANLSGPVRPELPSLDQFDHMLVHVSEGSEGLLIDCTHKSGDAQTLPAVCLADRHVLVLDAEDPRLVRLPSAPPETTKVSCVRRLTIVRDADVAAEETITLTGVLAANVRSYLEDSGLAEYRAGIQQGVMSSANQRLEQLTVDGLDASDGPLVLNARYVAARAFHSTGAQLVGRLPAVWDSAYLRVPYAEPRRSPLENRLPLTVESRVELELPDGWRVAGLESFNRQEHSTLLDWSIAAQGADRVLELTFVARLRTGRCAAEQYRLEYEQAEAATEALAAKVVLERVP